eukprot:CAMPEP_0197421542 /NCGR_PEP_ID=MMETSP1170-20131217/8995_1 /TAXON_ID=54406 /ORGANISM="Sarcinochrysis sp, Strain CCMP770" /LENGTH=227 /DNA_ID=CAMNT_0042948791 /DNA_START=27 /DNA_END=711 /DNA_ORIENTATION=+
MVVRGGLGRRWASWSVLALLGSSTVVRALRMSDDELDEEDLAELDSLAGEEGYGDEDGYADDIYDDAYGYFDEFGGGDLSELLGQEVDEEMLEALFSGDGDMAALLESLGLEFEMDGDEEEDYGTVRLVQDGEEDEEDAAADEAFANAEFEELVDGPAAAAEEFEPSVLLLHRWLSSPSSWATPGIPALARSLPALPCRSRGLANDTGNIQTAPDASSRRRRRRCLL